MTFFNVNIKTSDKLELIFRNIAHIKFYSAGLIIRIYKLILSRNSI